MKLIVKKWLGLILALAVFWVDPVSVFAEPITVEEITAQTDVNREEIVVHGFFY